MSLSQTLRQLADSLQVLAVRREALSRLSCQTEYAHEDDPLIVAADADLAAVRRVLRAYRAAVAAAEQSADAKLVEHFRTERRWVARVDARALREFAGAYRGLAHLYWQPPGLQEHAK